MIFMCGTKRVKHGHSWTEDGIRQTTALSIQKANTLSILYQVAKSENYKEAFRTSYLERTAEATHCHPRRGRRGSHIITLSPSTREQSDITQFFTVRKHLPTLNTLNSVVVGDLSFSRSVETLGKRFGL